MAEFRSIVEWVLRSGKRIAITVVGFALLLGGIALIPLPGPWTIPLVLGGLAVLGTEYAWARRALDETKRRSKDALESVKKRRRKKK